MTKPGIIIIQRAEYERRNPPHLVGKKSGKGYVGMFRTVVRWEVFVDGEFAFATGRRGFARSQAERRWPDAEIVYASKPRIR